MPAMHTSDALPPAKERTSSASGEGVPIGVIIPTYNRASILIQCIEHLERQTWKNFEVVVIDDGSTDSTRAEVEAFARRSDLVLRYARQENGGQARARNLAATLLRAPVCLMIGDDIFPSPDLVRQHLDLHRSRPGQRTVALGYTRWSKQGQVVTPFMDWLNEEGFQFAYGELRRGGSPSWKHFYTSNLSMKTSALLAHPFDETFRKYGMEDIELGYRLHSTGDLEMVFLPDAVAEHLHPTDVPRTCRRMIDAGAASFRFGQLWPEHQQTPSNKRLRKLARAAITSERWGLPLLRKAAALWTQYRCPNPLLLRVLHLHYALGHRKAAAGSIPSS